MTIAQARSESSKSYFPAASCPIVPRKKSLVAPTPQTPVLKSEMSCDRRITLQIRGRTKKMRGKDGSTIKETANSRNEKSTNLSKIQTRHFCTSQPKFSTEIEVDSSFPFPPPACYCSCSDLLDSIEPQSTLPTLYYSSSRVFHKVHYLQREGSEGSKKEGVR